MNRLPLVRLCVLLAILAGFASCPPRASAADRPNILWITCEDMSPQLGCYGDAYSRSPTIDRLAAEGVRYTRCFTHIGVCAPSRSGIITGMYPPSIGSQHMRSQTKLPDYVKCFPEYLREAGYYCTNNSKTDYNFPVPKNAWDVNGNKAHWKNRPEGKPFFAVFNDTVTHESQIRAGEKGYQNNTKRLTDDQRHDPAKAPLPPYFPDTPIVRQDVARNYDNITAMDYHTADLLRELDEAGLADDTIVFFYSDHGAGLPRSKRWLYDSSTHVPLIVRVPQKWRNDKLQTTAMKPGTVNDELVAFVDLAPTVLSLAGLEIPKHMQGQAFLGAHKAPAPREFVYGCRDRMDERVDMIRSVRDKRFKYIRNYQWWKPYAQHLNYMEEMPTMQEWRRLAAEGKLNDVQSLFMAKQKPREELYDCDADPHEVKNLANDPKFADDLKRLRTAHERWTEQIHDTGYLPEYVLQEYMKTGPDWRDKSPAWETSRMLHAMQTSLEDSPSVMESLQRASSGESKNEALTQLMNERRAAGSDPSKTSLASQAIQVRLQELLATDAKYQEFLQGGKVFVPNQNSPLLVNLASSATACRAQVGAPNDGLRQYLSVVDAVFREGLKSDNPYLRHAAVLAIDDLGDLAATYLDDIRAMLKIDDGYAARVGEYVVKSRGKK